MGVGRTLALIPAKAASTRLPRKNMAVLGGETLVARAVRCAREAGVFDDIVVTTEDAEIANESKRAGARVHLRPERLAIDPAGVADVTLFVLDELEGQGDRYDTVAILLPTSPFRSPDDCRAALQLYAARGVQFLMSVSRYDHTPLTALQVRDGLLEPLLPEYLARTGAKADSPLPEIVRANGAITICDVKRMRIERDYYAYPLAAYEMPWDRGVDIDTEADLQYAEFLLATGVVR